MIKWRKVEKRKGKYRKAKESRDEQRKVEKCGGKWRKVEERKERR